MFSCTSEEAKARQGPGICRAGARSTGGNKDGLSTTFRNFCKDGGGGLLWHLTGQKPLAATW